MRALVDPLDFRRLRSRRRTRSRRLLFGVPVFFLLMWGFGPVGDDPSGAPGQRRALGDSRSAPAVIEGRVEVNLPPARRTASRYGARGGSGVSSIQPIPALVYLRPRGGATPPPIRTAMAQEDTTFSPAVVVVPVGSTVDFPNRDDFFHNVFSYSSPARFDLGRYPRGESKDVTFSEAGVVKVYCEVHEFMRGAILVTDAPAWTVLDDDGSFTLEGVSPGSWTIVAWHADLGEVEQRVTVREGERTRVDLTID